VVEQVEGVARVERMSRAANRIEETVRRMRGIVRIKMFQHTSPHLPPMLDLGRSSDAD
jgi:hypothetical protein